MGSWKIVWEILTAQPIHTSQELFNLAKKISDLAGMYMRVAFLFAISIFIWNSIGGYSIFEKSLLIIASVFFMILAVLLSVTAALTVFQSSREKIWHLATGRAASPAKNVLLIAVSILNGIVTLAVGYGVVFAVTTFVLHSAGRG